MRPSRFHVASALLVAGISGAVHAGPVQLRVTVQSMVPQTSVAFAPLRFGVGNGTFDAFSENQGVFLFGQSSAATAPIARIAEAGSGANWFPAFTSVDPNAALGSVGASPLLPGQTASTIVEVDPSIHRYFTFATMVVPSNDQFIGNDDPMEYKLFDANGKLKLTSISQFGNSVWDAGTETTDAANAAFLQGSNAAGRIDENGVVTRGLANINAFNGLTTAAGYTFDRAFAGGDEIYRISFEIVPAPSTTAMLGLCGLVMGRRRRA
ncbi:MAG: spondin domain-containing protein [Phycisphaerales bacterium]